VDGFPAELLKLKGSFWSPGKVANSFHHALKKGIQQVIHTFPLCQVDLLDNMCVMLDHTPESLQYFSNTFLISIHLCGILYEPKYQTIGVKLTIKPTTFPSKRELYLFKMGNYWGTVFPDKFKPFCQRFRCATCYHWLPFSQPSIFIREHHQSCRRCHCGVSFKDGSKPHECRIHEV